MRCLECGFDVPPGMQFCGNCATPVGVGCPHCGSVNPHGFRFCGHCGGLLALTPEKAKSSQAHIGALEPGAERREVTVVFCDLSDSTMLSARLDPEELRDVILAYRQVCAEAVTRFGGQVARYLGDGLMIYFGYPRAGDADAENAIRAALEIIAQVGQLGTRLRSRIGQQLSAHIGIHTGLVVAGDLVGGGTSETAAIVGETPNIAARLEGLAEPNVILISEATWRLVRHQFDCAPIGAVQVKGIARELQPFRVTGEHHGHGWLDAMRGRDLAPLMDREQEMTQLADKWHKVKMGAGQALLVGGEPGIGKSRLVQAFEHDLADEPHTLLVCQCAPHSSNSALQPIIDVLIRQMMIGRDDPGPDRLKKLEAFVATAALSPEDGVPLLAALMSIPYAPRDTPVELSPQRLRDKTIELLLEWFVAQGRERPLLFIVEDVHWADASTLEVLGLLFNQLPGLKIMLLLTARPEFGLPWTARSHFAQINLAPLDPTDAADLVRILAGDKALPDEVVTELVARTDGVPLFVEELTKTVLESSALSEHEDRYELVQPLRDLDIPSTLRGSLTARLDRLETTKGVAQLAATIGREFSYALLRAVAPLDESVLQTGLRRLVDAELLYQQGLPPRATYAFKHALIQEAAYRSLLRATRRKYHERIADVLTAQFAEIVEMRPELVAQHQEMAGRALESVRLLRRAAKRASDRSANIEAIAHLNKALSQLDAMPDSPERRHEEVRARVALGAALIATKGYAAPEVEQTYARARTLCRDLGDAPQLLPVLRGLQSFYQVRGPLRTARETSAQILALAEQIGDPAALVQAHRRLGWCLFCLGRMAEAREHLGRVLALYDRAQAQAHIDVFDSDPGVIGLVNSGWLEWFVGCPDNARERSRRAIELARDLSHPLSLAYALCLSAAVSQCCGDIAGTLALATETEALAAENGFAYWTAWAAVLHGWAIAKRGDPDAGEARMRDGLARYRKTGAELFRPYSLMLLADVNLGAGRIAEGLDYVAEGLADGARTDVHFVDAELHRLRGELLLAGAAETAAEAAFADARGIAQSQGALMLEIRLALSLGGLRRRQGRLAEARDLVAQVYSRFDPAAPAPDLVAARRFLDAAS